MKYSYLGILSLVSSIMSCTSGSQQQLIGECSDDSQCNPGFRCVEGNCLCTFNDACGDGMYCNSLGFCQTKSGCRLNDDCKDQRGTFCDPDSGRCLSSSTCGSDAHCVLGEICLCDGGSGSCAPEERSCQAGCMDDGDCDFTQGDYCERDEADLLAGTPGQCTYGCSTDEFCAFGEVCQETVAAGKRCGIDGRDYCTDCTGMGSEFNPHPCGIDTVSDRANMCLLDSAVLPNSCSSDGECEQWFGQGTKCIVTDFFGFSKECRREFCAPDCSQGQACPSGYQCGDVIILTASQCTSNSDCSSGSCVVGEAGGGGYCTCAADSDCPPEPCINGRCAYTGVTCSGLFCQAIKCIGGGCFIGSACTPIEGLTCEELK